MTKVLSFSALEVLPALLDHTKVQTIRPAWKKYYVKTSKLKSAIKIPIITMGGKQATIETKPRFAVGETVSIQWHQRTSPKGAEFCKVCGTKAIDGRGIGLYCPNKYCDNLDGVRDGFFPKILGTVKITDVFQIEMSKRTYFFGNSWETYGIKCGDVDYELNLSGPVKFLEDLANSDGFEDSVEMFGWFDKHYDLSTPKMFWVYRFKWLSPSS
jgi:hypothetical protein